MQWRGSGSYNLLEITLILAFLSTVIFLLCNYFSFLYNVLEKLYKIRDKVSHQAVQLLNNKGFFKELLSFIFLLWVEDSIQRCIKKDLCALPSHLQILTKLQPRCMSSKVTDTLWIHIQVHSWTTSDLIIGTYQLFFFFFNSVNFCLVLNPHF